MFKRIISFLITTLLIFAMAFSAYAQTGQVTEPQGTYAVPVSSNEAMEVKGVRIGEISNGMERGVSTLYASIIRNGTSKECQIYLHWSGPDAYNSWKFSKVVVDNGNSLFNKKYGTINKRTLDVYGEKSGSVCLGEVDIPKDVTEARVKISGLKGYNMKSASWVSALIVGKIGQIN